MTGRWGTQPKEGARWLALVKGRAMLWRGRIVETGSGVAERDRSGEGKKRPGGGLWRLSHREGRSGDGCWRL